jgi:hypothetical protein
VGKMASIGLIGKSGRIRLQKKREELSPGKAKLFSGDHSRKQNLKLKEWYLRWKYCVDNKNYLLMNY